MSPKVFVVGRDASVYALFYRFGWEITRTIDEADLVQFTGGADINPAIYNAHKHPSTGFFDIRDKAELLAYGVAKQTGKAQAGICRGGQLLNALCGGDMWQDVDNHHGNHEMVDLRTKKVMTVNSIHHQMMIPGPGGEVIATANVSRSRERMSKIGQQRAIIRSEGDTYNDPEVIWYRAEQCFCFQGHPEYSTNRDDVDMIYMEYIKEFFGLGL